MGRLVTPAASSSAARPVGLSVAAETPDSYFDRVAKYVPAEIVGAYLAVEKMMGTGGDDPALALGTLAAFTILTPLYFRSLPGPLHSRRIHMVVSTLAFLLWSYALPGAAWTALGLENSRLAGVLLIVGSLALGLISPDPPEDAANGDGLNRPTDRPPSDADASG